MELNGKGVNGRTQLENTCKIGHTDVVRLLVLVA